MALGMESGAINDSQISASSSFDIYHGPPRARLHTMESSASARGAWSSKIADAHQWIQVDLVELKNVTYIATQGRNRVNQYVTMYKLEQSSDGVNFTSYKKQGDSSATVSRFCRQTAFSYRSETIGSFGNEGSNARRVSIRKTIN